MGRQLKQQEVEFAVHGGSIYAAAGKRWRELGRQLGLAAIKTGRVELVPLDSLSSEACVATINLIGQGSSASAWDAVGGDARQAIRLLQDTLKETVHGVVAEQNSNPFSGWLGAAASGGKLVDGVSLLQANPEEGEAHSSGPVATGDLPRIQSAVGGSRTNQRYLELVARSHNAKIAAILRSAAELSGGFIASCHTPLRARHLREQMLPGSISRAITLGEAIFRARRRGVNAIVDTLVSRTQGELLAQGRVTDISLKRDQAANMGGYLVLQQGQTSLRLHLHHGAVVTLSRQETTRSALPGEMVLLDRQGESIGADEIRQGDVLYLLHLPHQSQSAAHQVWLPMSPVSRAAHGYYAMAG